MKRINLLIIILFTFTNYSELFAQLNWTEHLSHDRISRNNLGFFFEDDNLTLVMDNYSGYPTSIEKITGYEAKEVLREFDFNYDAKSNFISPNLKQLLLINPQSLDIYGFGAESIIMDSGVLKIKSLSTFIQDPCIEAIIPANDNVYSECITDFNFDHLIIDSSGQILERHEESPMTLHKGLTKNYRVQNDSLFEHDLTDTTFLFEVPNFKNLYNNPFTGELVILLDSTIISYKNNVDLKEENLLGIDVISVDFSSDAMYYLSKVGNGHKVFKSLYSGGSSVWMEIDQAPNGQKVEIFDFSVKGIEVYLFGIHINEITKTRNHIVQKLNLLSPIEPPRNDLAIKSFSVTSQPVEFNNFIYTYAIEVINNGQYEVNSFDIFSDLKEYNELYYSDIDLTFHGSLLANEITTFQGTFTASAIPKININIPGSDFMLDAYPNDNSASFNLTTSIIEHDQDKITFMPNPTNGIINIENKTLSNPIINIFDIHGRKLKLTNQNNGIIDISHLASGQYWIRIIDNNTVITQSIIKN